MAQYSTVIQILKFEKCQTSKNWIF